MQPHPNSSTAVQYPFYEYVYVSNIQLTKNRIDGFTVSHLIVRAILSHAHMLTFIFAKCFSLHIASEL